MTSSELDQDSRHSGKKLKAQHPMRTIVTFIAQGIDYPSENRG